MDQVRVTLTDIFLFGDCLCMYVCVYLCSVDMLIVLSCSFTLLIVYFSSNRLQEFNKCRVRFQAVSFLLPISGQFI